jgi:hypothetical protein
MPISDITHCIVCDDVRAEQNNKLTILGFYGLSPEAGVRVQVGQQGAKLVFLLSAGRISGVHTIATRILSPDRTTLAETPPQTHNLDPLKNNAVNFLICSFSSITFYQGGRHTFELIVDQYVKYSGLFTIVPLYPPMG